MDKTSPRLARALNQKGAEMKTKLSFDEHCDLAAWLFATSAELAAHHLLVCIAYANGHGPGPGAKFLKAMEAIDSARSAMDSQLALDFLQDYDHGIYFPGHKSSA
jgi:hypothetical protein